MDNKENESMFILIMNMLSDVNKKVDSFDEKLDDIEKKFIGAIEPLKLKVTFLISTMMVLISAIIGWYIEH